MKNKLLKYPILEIVIGILWLYPFKNIINTKILPQISWFIVINTYKLISIITHFFGAPDNYDEAKAIGILLSFISFFLTLIIKVIMLVFVIILIRKAKKKYL